jgi:hypothetical protein
VYRSAARLGFDATLDRVEGLLLLHRRLHGKRGKPPRHVSDLLRGALVLALAALDGLILETVIEAVPLLAKKSRAGQVTTKWIADFPDDILDGMAMPDPAVVLAKVARKKIGHTTFQKAIAIEGMLHDALGCDAPWELAANDLSTTGVRWTAAEVCEWLDKYVERRDRIAHGGDLKPGRAVAQGIELPKVQTATQLVRSVGHAVCDVVEARVNAP